MLKSAWRAAIVLAAVVTGLGAGPSSAGIVDPAGFGLQVAPGPVFTFSHPMIISEYRNQLSGTSHIYPVNTVVKKDGIIIGRDTTLNISLFNFRAQSTYNFYIETDNSRGSTVGWGSSGPSLVAVDSLLDRNAIEIIVPIGTFHRSAPGYHPETDYALMRMEFAGFTGGIGGPLSTFPAIQKLEALVSLASSNAAIVTVDFTVTPLEDSSPPPPLPTNIPVPASGLLVLSALGVGAAWAHRRQRS